MNKLLFVGKNIRYKVEGEHISVYKPQQSRQNAITGLEGCGVVLIVCTGYQTGNYANY